MASPNILCREIAKKTCAGNYCIFGEKLNGKASARKKKPVL